MPEGANPVTTVLKRKGKGHMKTETRREDVKDGGRDRRAASASRRSPGMLGDR